MDVNDFLSELKRDLDKEPDAPGLRAIRAKLDDFALPREMTDYLRSKTNNPAELMNRLVALKRQADDMNASRGTQKTTAFLVTGAGGAAMVGSIALVATAVSGFFLLPLILGATVAAHGYLSATEAAEEERLYQQITSRLEAIEKELTEKLK